MAVDEERLSESSPTVNTVTVSNELPAKPFRITLELPLFLILAGMSLCGAALNNILLYRTCVYSLNYSKEECHIFLVLEKNNHTKMEEEVQKYQTTISTVRSVIEAVLPAILSLFLGVWSDTHGRKPLIVWPLFGITVSAILQVVYSMMDNLGPWWFILTILPYSMCGGFTIFFTGAFCYLSDVTDAENRSLRMTVMEAAVSLGSIVGSLLSAPVLRLVGNIWLIFIATALNVVAYAYSTICIRESLTGAIEGGVSSVLDFLLVKEMCRECFKRRPNNGRAQLLLLTLANSLSIFILYGIISLEYMYTREKLHWTLSEYSIYGAVSTSISFVGSFIGIGLLQKLLGINDLITTCIAFISYMIDFILRTIAVVSWQMYLGAGLSLFKGLSSPLIRSFLTKILPVVDIAKAFALMSAIEGLCPLIAPLVYNSLYWYTISIFPGAIYVLSCGVLAICLTCIIMVQYYRWNALSEYQPLDSSIRS